MTAPAPTDLAPTGAALTAGVAGWPIAHSLSPLIMRAWIDAAGIHAVYTPYPIAPDTAAEDIRALARLGLTGLNITLPHKSLALDIADAASAAARAIGAANRLVFQDGRIEADNTDAPGFLAALRDAGVDPAAGPALVLGAGGAARAIVHALKEAGAPALRLANRTRDRAERLAADLAPDADIADWADREAACDGAALIVNTTSLGLKGEGSTGIDFTAAARGAAAADIVYTPLRTGFLDAAARQGLKTVDGLGMLIGQARPSFEAFFGAPPPDDVDIRARLERALGERS